MKHKLSVISLILLLASPACGWSQTEQASPNAQLVNVFIGTNGMGHTFPGACYPYGAVQLSPDTDTIPHNIDGHYQPRVYDYCAGYQHRDSS
ncbi:MAG: glycoside hydrolase family 92 protein, partial [Bacteroidales bacterium]|nr:glycoside hydrolase family 92 protein [Bacteroidales bacterium]